MWEQAPPAEADTLRQGDLLTQLPFPRRGTLVLSTEEMRASVYPSRAAVVLDQCCTIENKWTVLLGRVEEVRRLPPDHKMYQALVGDQPGEGKLYAKYAHLLEPRVELPEKANKLWVVNLTERVSVGVKAAPDLAWLQTHRVARMVPGARARLRARLVYHFGEVAEEDQQELVDQGLDRFGRAV